VIGEACLRGPAHFLGHPQTLARMQTDYLYPVVGDRTSPKEWLERGSPTLVERAIRKTKDILERHFPSHLPDSVDSQIRARLPIRLPRARMGRR
jgi:trimethylamine--corrinoid protein Co-methyltransferase